MGYIPGRWAGGGEQIQWPGGRRAFIMSDPAQPGAGGHAPAYCGYGHALRPAAGAGFNMGTVQVAFVHCTCPSAQARQSVCGHIAVICLGCKAAGRLTVFYDPPCHVPATAQEPR